MDLVKWKINKTLFKLISSVSRFSPPGGLKVRITLASFIFIIHSIFSNSEQLKQISLDKSSYSWLFIGIFWTSLSIIINAFAWKTLLIWLWKESIDVPIIDLYLRSNLLKYIPGGIWLFVERLRVLRIHMPVKNALNTVLLEPIQLETC